jgi:hypothetical protein
VPTTDHDPIPEPLPEGCTLHRVSPTDPLGVAAERFVYGVYRDAGFCAESPRAHVEETEPWRAGSVLHVVCDGDGAVVGTARTVIGEFSELPAAEFADVELGSVTVCEVGSIAVEMSLRGAGVAAELHAAVFAEGVRAGLHGWCFVVEQWMIDVLVDRYRFAPRLLGSPTYYMGGDIVSVYIDAAQLRSEFPRERPSAYRRAVASLDAATLAASGWPAPAPAQPSAG